MQADAALLLIDLQNDFMPGGTLPVPFGDEIVPVANRLIPCFRWVIATQDWHPANHGSFASNNPGHKPGDIIKLAGIPQTLWPAHCIQYTSGAELVKPLDTLAINHMVTKGTNPQIDSYSGFYDNAHQQSTDLMEYLHNHHIQTIYLCGIATDYCVKFTALDACQAGFNVYLIEDACRGVNLQPNDSLQAMATMKSAGVTIISSQDIINSF